jgi:HD-GYP domain-containing protein (c-di-GMP phosphodiesterase class II)
MRAQEVKTYSEHVPGALSLIQHFAPEIPERVKNIIFQHHEKFDGTGYPRRLQGFKMDDVAQLLAIADLLDSIMTGQWDLQERTLMETFTALEGVEKARTFPEYFNPEVFTAVLRWIRTYSSKSNSAEAIGVVEKQVQALVSQTKF